MSTKTDAVRQRFAAFAREASHGLLLKLLAFASRATFLLLVVSDLAAGELTDYLFLSSIAIVAGRLLGFGLEEQLPLVVAGSLDVARRFVPVSSILVMVQLVLSILVLVHGSPLLSTALLTVCYVNTSFLAGLIRTVRVAGSERLRDLHWIVFGVSAALLPVEWSAARLITLMAACLMLIHLLEIHLNGRDGIAHRLSIPNLTRVLSGLAGTAGDSWRKLIAAASVLLMGRGIVLWPRSLSFDVQLDDIAYALLLGEAFWQTAMIVVYRRFAFYCAQRPEFSQMYRDALGYVGALLVYAAAAATGTALLGPLGVEISGFSRWWDVSAMVMFFGTLAGYLLLRYTVWVSRDFDWRLIALELSVVLGQGVIVLTVAPAYWPWMLVLLGFAMLASALLLVRVGAKAADQPVGDR